VIKSFYDVLTWYNNNRGSPSSHVILNLFELWKSLHALFINISDEGWKALKNLATNLGISVRNETERWLFLYALETYLNILMRAITLSKIGSSASNHINFENNIISRRNIFEPNVFEWIFEASKDRYVPPNLKRQLIDSIDLLLTVLYNINLFQISFDMFREIYQNILPGEVRKSLGEFYTNEDIVNKVLDAAGLDANAINNLYNKWNRGERDTLILDPACGSGSFLVAVIRRIFRSFNRPPGNIVKFIEENIVGIDINPFAVEMTKLNIIMTIGDEIRKLGGTYVPSYLRIYWADSLAKVKNQTKLGYQVLTIYMPTLQTILGKEAISIPRVANKDPMMIFDKVAKYVERNMNVEDLIGEEHLENVAQAVKDLYNDLKKIYDAGNSRIIEMIRNIIAVQSFVNRCSYVIGNPPWVRIHNISRSVIDYLKENYEWLKSGSSYTPGFKKTRTPFREQFDYSMAFVERGLEFLRDEGILSYVITSKIIKATYAGKMREDLIEKYTILEIIDYSLYPISLFQDVTNYPLIISIKKSSPGDKRNNIKVTVYNTIGSSKSFHLEQWMLPLYSGTNYPNNMRSPWVLAPPEVITVLKKIINKGHRLGDLYKVTRGVETDLNKAYIGDLSSCTPAGTVKLNLEENLTADIEESLVYPIVRGENIHPYKYSFSNYIIFPHDPASLDPLWDNDQVDVLITFGLLRQGVEVEASGGVLKYIIKNVSANYANIIQNSINTLRSKGYQVNTVTPCAVYMCLDIRKSGRGLVLRINVEIRTDKTTTLIYNVTGLRIPNAPNATQHFISLLEELVKRRSYKASLPPWAVFGVRKEKFEEYRIGWQEMTIHIEAAHLPVTVNINICGTTKQKLLIPIQTTYFVVEKDPLKALKLLIYMNSDFVRNLVKLWAWTARGGYYRHTSYNMGMLPIPKELVECKLWRLLTNRLNQQEKYIDLNTVATKILSEAEVSKNLEKELIQTLELNEDEYRMLIEYGKWLNELGMPPQTESIGIEEVEEEEIET
jgi:SAM-dependent methyltransferase